MIRYKLIFVEYKPKKNLGSVSFDNNHKGKIRGIGKICINPSFYIENVSLVDGLKYNLISISQLCDKGYLVTFTYEKSFIKGKNENSMLIDGYQYGNVYALSNKDCHPHKCLTTTQDLGWLWHKKFGHFNMCHISKLSNEELVVDLPKVKYVIKHVCEACQKGKQIETSFHPKSMFQQQDHFN